MNYFKAGYLKRMGLSFFVIGLFTSMFSSAFVYGDDWPTRLHDISRCGVSSEQLTMPLSQAWVYETDNAPESAWTESPAVHDYYHYWFNLKPRQNYDFSFDTSVSGGFLYFGSSNTGQISCLNAVTGQEVWTYFTEGPVRFAPTIADGKIYAGSDDGFVYCLNAGDGTLVWKERVGGEDMIWGNEHMISVWPVRSSVLVSNGQVFWAAGLFPQEGMYLCKRNAADGTGGWTVTPQLPPQGYLLATPDLLFVPSGRTYPMVFSRSSGAFAGFINSSTRDGGAWALLTPDNNSFWTGPNVSNQTQEYNASSRAYIASINGANYLIADAIYAYYNTDTHLIKINRSNRSQVWAVEEDYPYSIIEGGTTIYAGGNGKVAAFATSDGEKVWEASINGQAYGLALADNCLYVGTDTGNIYCFSAKMPAVTNADGAIVQDSTTAVLNGKLLSEGAGQTSVVLYWGKTDGQMQPQDWQNSVDLGLKTPGPISEIRTGLESNAIYYYRYCAVNSYGTAWANQSDVLITGEISLQVSDGNASESQGDLGQFSLQRPAWSVGESLTVNYSVSGTATSVDDYEALSDTVTFLSGQAVASITILPVDDSEMETDETVVVTLGPGGYIPAAQHSGTVTIADNDSVEGYQYRMKIQFGGYLGTETLNDFPALITLGNVAPMGLVAHWDFDADFTDSASMHDLTAVNGASIVAGGKIGGAASFDRSQEQYARVNETLFARDGDYTVVAWYKSNIADMGIERQFVFESENYAVSYGLRDGGGVDIGQVYINTTNGVGSYNVAGGAGVEWHHIALTHTASTGVTTAYLDGTYAGEKTLLGDLLQMSYFVIGGHRDNTGRNFDGLIDDVAVFDNVISTSYIEYLAAGNAVNDSLVNFDYSQLAYANGSDLRFVSADLQTFLSYEFEEWDVGGDSKIWVNVPEITGSDSYIWLYWGNPDSDQMPACTVDGSTWSDDFANVWHMNNSAGVLTDATLADNDGAVSGDPADISGVIGDAVEFDGVGDYFSLSNPLTIGSVSNTVSAWVKVPTADSFDVGERVGILLGSYNAAPNVNWELYNVGQMRIYWNGGNPSAYGITDLRDNTWHHIAWTRDKQSGQIYFYIDGQLEKTVTTAGSDIVLNSAHKIGADNRGSTTPCFHGSVDELRVSAVARSVDWIKASADNINSGTFIWYGEISPFND